jgi:hypothetical protein
VADRVTDHPLPFLDWREQAISHWPTHRTSLPRAAGGLGDCWWSVLSARARSPCGLCREEARRRVSTQLQRAGVCDHATVTLTPATLDRGRCMPPRGERRCEAPRCRAARGGRQLMNAGPRRVFLAFITLFMPLRSRGPSRRGRPRASPSLSARPSSATGARTPASGSRTRRPSTSGSPPTRWRRSTRTSRWSAEKEGRHTIAGRAAATLLA